MADQPRRLVVAITGATGAVYGVRLLRQLAATPLRNMVAVTEMGGIVFPPLPSVYHKPASIEETVDHTVGRVIDVIPAEEAVAKGPKSQIYHRDCRVGLGDWWQRFLRFATASKAKIHNVYEALSSDAGNARPGGRCRST